MPDEVTEGRAGRDVLLLDVAEASEMLLYLVGLGVGDRGGVARPGNLDGTTRAQ